MLFTMHNRQRGDRTKVKKHTHTRTQLTETVGQGNK